MRVNRRLVYVLAFLMIISFFGGRAFTEDYSGDDSGIKTDISPHSRDVPLKEGSAAAYGPDGRLRDPFAPLISKYGLVLITSEIDVTGLSLKGIIYSEGQALAVIDQEVLREGDSIGGYIVVSIEEKLVILKKGNEGFTLKLEE